MPAHKFWQIIKRAGESCHDPDAHADALRAALRELALVAPVIENDGNF
jgi:hypothetical protein